MRWTRFTSPILLILLLMLSILIVGHPSSFYVQSSTDEITQQLSSKEEERLKLQAQLSETLKQKKTLESQLSIVDSQNKITEIKIEETDLKIEKLKRDINDLSSRITRLSSSVDNMTEVLLKRITQTYKYGQVGIIDMLFSSYGFADLVERLKYIQVAQANDKKVLYQLQATKTAYNDQKQDKEVRQTEAEKLSKELEIYKAQLLEQKKQKEQLLNATKNDAANFQSRLNEIEREISQIQKAAGVLISTEPRHVSRGELIGLMGNSGYSTGPHLHFGVYNISSLSQYNYYSNYENPVGVLQQSTVKWWDYPGCNENLGQANDKAVGSGSWPWPMSSGSLYISQGFGDTCFTGKLYGGRPHPALDMYNNADITVKAVEEGQAYFCRNCLGDGGNGVFLFHPNGKMTLYWHLQ